MQDQNPTSDIVQDMEKARRTLSQNAATSNIVDNVVDKLLNARNILIAMSSDPSTEELAGAIGMAIFLDKIGKHVTTLFSGKAPKVLEFLEPEKYFTDSPEAIQDFVVSVNKDKADYLRYKVEGDYVKIYITPYKTKLSQDDLEYSYGDYNVELVLSLNVMNVIDLDESLREQGLIMQNATTINVTTGKPGKFAEIEWSNTKASSVSEMLAELAYRMESQIPVTKEEATAFLTGIVVATNRFSNARTTAGAMNIASKLLKSNANQLLISQHVVAGAEGMLNIDTRELEEEASLEVEQGPEVKLDVRTLSKQEQTADKLEESDKLDEDLEAAKADLMKENTEVAEEIPQLIGPQIPTPGSSLPKVEKPVEEPERIVIKPVEPEPNQYGKMLEEALNNTVSSAEKQFTEAIVSQPIEVAPQEEILPPPPAPPVSSDTYMPPMPAAV